MFCAALLLQAHLVQAGSATWNFTPTNGDWNNATNWTPATVPNGPSDVRTFATSSQAAISVTDITGFGAVQVNAGTLAGTGRILGDVSVGPATIAAIVDPGTGKHLGTLTFLKTLTLNSRGNLKVSFNSSTVTTDQVVAKGVTLNTGALISISDLGTAVLPTGTVFMLISNTATTPIVGTFRNLADGSSLVVGSNTYLVNYAGDTGNDLTLTVQ